MRYVIALILLALLSLISFSILGGQISYSNQLDRLLTFVSLENRQVFEAGISARSLVINQDTKARERFRKQLKEDVSRIEQGYNELLYSQPTPGKKLTLPTELRPYIFNEPNNLNKALREYISHLRLLSDVKDSELSFQNEHFVRVSHILEDRILSDKLTEARVKFQEKNNLNKTMIVLLNYFGFFSSIFLLFLTGYFVFRPMIKSFREYADNLIGLNHKLKEELEIRQKVEAALKESEAVFRTLTDSSPTFISLVGREGLFHYFNKSWLEFSGKPLEEEIGSGWTTEIHLQDVNRFMEAFQSAFEARERFEVEYRYKNADGDYRWLYSIGAPRLTTQGLFSGYVISSVDITERKRDEANLKDLAQKLSVTNSELQDFALVASHDLQEPLRKVLAFSERLRSGFADQLGEKGLDYLTRMESATARMQLLINSLLNYSRLSTRAQPFVSVDQSNVLQDVLADLEVKIQDTKAMISFESLPVVEGDPVQIYQLFQNLISNSLKYQPAQNIPDIQIQFYENPDLLDQMRFPDVKHFPPSQFCHIVFQDNGIGFENKYADKIFRAFQRLHGRSEYEGTGMGLTIVRRIVERHNGAIDAYSVPGEGSQFLVILPYHQPKQGDYRYYEVPS